MESLSNNEIQTRIKRNKKPKTGGISFNILNCKSFTQYHVAGLFIYPLKISENLWFSDVFRGIERDHWYDMSYLKIFLLLYNKDALTPHFFIFLIIPFLIK